jgi:N-acetylmuramoyl-L-alanine amidase
MRKIKHIVVHHNGKAGRTIEDIRRTHVRGNGWADIGYHWVQHENGAWLRGRPESRAGAGVEGLNAHAIHVCVVGNFNKEPMAITQSTSLHFKLLELTSNYPDAIVLGHRETGKLVDKPTRKSCPGKLVDMNAIRAMLEHGRNA